jgi:hypothetical protein
MVGSTNDRAARPRAALTIWPLSPAGQQASKRRSSLCGVLVWLRGLPSQRRGLFLYTRTLRPLVLGNRCRSRFLPQMLFKRTRGLASRWLDLAEDRLRLDRLSRNDVGSTFFPWAFGPFLARQESMPPKEGVSPPPSSAPLRPLGHPIAQARSGTPTGGCVVDRLRPVDRHRGRGGRGLENSKEKRHGQHRFL